MHPLLLCILSNLTGHDLTLSMPGVYGVPLIRCKTLIEQARDSRGNDRAYAHRNTLYGLLSDVDVGACRLRSSGAPRFFRFASQYEYTASRSSFRAGHATCRRPGRISKPV